MSTTVIAARHPEDGREWENQCARCGSSVGRRDCDSCGGAGHFEEDDPEAIDFGTEIFTCDVCEGFGGWFECLSSAGFCQDNPLPGREAVERGSIEWYSAE